MSLEGIAEHGAAEPSVAEPATLAAHVLARLARHLEQALGEANLTLSQYRLLVFLDQRPDAANRLATQLHVRPPSLTALVDGMVARSLVDRSADLDDRRRVKIVITEDGKRLLQLADAVAAQRLRHVEALDPDRVDLVDSLGNWHNALDGSLRERLQR